MASHQSASPSTPARRRSHTTSKRQSKQRPPPKPFVQDEVDAIASELTSLYEAVRQTAEHPPMQGTIDQQPIILDATPPTNPIEYKAQPRIETHTGGRDLSNAQEGSQERRYVFYNPNADSHSGTRKDAADTTESDTKRPHLTKPSDKAPKEQRFIFIPQSDPGFYSSFSSEDPVAEPQGTGCANAKPGEKHNTLPKPDSRLNNSSTEYSRSSSQHSSTDGSRSDGIRIAHSSTGGLKSPSDQSSTPAKAQQNRDRHSSVYFDHKTSADPARDRPAPTPPPKPDKYKPPTSQPGEDANVDAALPSNDKSRRRRSGRYSFVKSELPQLNTKAIRTESAEAHDKNREPGLEPQGNSNYLQDSSNANTPTFQQVPRRGNGHAASPQQTLPYPTSPYSPTPQQAPDWQPRLNTNPPIITRGGGSRATSPAPYPPHSPSTRPIPNQGSRNYPQASLHDDLTFPTAMPYPQPLRSPISPARDSPWPSDPLLSPRLSPAKPGSTIPLPTPGKPEFKPFLTCARSGGVTGKNDWFTLIKCPSFSICPTCLQESVASSPFKTYFRPSPRPPDVEIKCDFSNIWVRTAWNFTVQQRRQNLDLLQSVATVATSVEPCPGDSARAGSWYCIVDPDTGEPVEDFDMCRSCVSNIEALFPPLSGVFVVIPSKQGQERVCAMRAGSKRFSKYFRMIESTADTARVSFRLPDTRGLTHFIRKRSSMRECTNDRLVFDKAWHTIPEIPHFTICEECYNDVVWPAIDGGSMLASKCSRSMSLVWSGNNGVSCQLYSQRMRQIFEEAVTRNDLEFLKRKAAERRENEIMIKKRLNHMLQIYASQLHTSKAGGTPDTSSAQGEAAGKFSTFANERQANGSATATLGGGGARGPRETAMEIVRLTDEWKKWE
ncbi:MAG: hypothetical protein M1839_003318 [Geoglossum umbratile]|nr:MAG: hypothetical protein M1839_003318 [Geoglossum umbratile]